MAQLVEHLTLDFGSGCDFMVCEIEPCNVLHADSADPAWDSLSLSLSPSLSAPSLVVCSVSQDKNFKKKKKK